MSTTRQYELVYIVPGETTEDDLAALQTQVVGVVDRFSGTIERTEPWGRRRLAYEIGPHKEGVYTLVQFSGSPELVKELDRRLRVADMVVRHLIVRCDEAPEAAAPPEAGADAAGEGAPPAADRDEASREAGDQEQAEA